MSKKEYFCPFLVIVVLFTVFSNLCYSQDELSEFNNNQFSDTIRLDEISLDSIKFYLGGNFSRNDNDTKDTILIPIDGKIYRIPYKVTSTALINTQRQPKYYSVTGLSLSQDSLDIYISELFRNPRGILKDSISSANWHNSDIYLRYFEPYDPNSPYREGSKKTIAEKEENELDFLMSDGKYGYTEQNYEDFPLPQSIDLEVDLTKSPRTLTVLGLDFNFDKLNKRFQELLFRYGYSTKKEYMNRRSNERKKDKN